MKRPTQWCDSCESTVYTDDVHSCYDAKAVREQQERESALTTAERERDQFASMLHDCENERDSWKHRAERAERVVESAVRLNAAWYIAALRALTPTQEPTHD